MKVLRKRNIEKENVMISRSGTVIKKTYNTRDDKNGTKRTITKINNCEIQNYAEGRHKEIE